MLEPNRAQWSIIWIVAVLTILLWPPEQGPSLGVKAVNWAADPAGTLPALPPPLPIGLEDNGDAVTAHDLQEAEYYRAYAGSGVTRWRMKARDGRDPFSPQTERQLLVGLVALSALGVWRLNKNNRAIE